MTDTFNRHMSAIRHTVTKSNIIGIRKALNAYERKSRRYSTSCTSPDWTHAQVQACFSAITRYQPVISGEWHDSGIATLKRALTRYKGRFNAAHARIIDNIWHFRLVDWHCVGLHWHPVVRVVSGDGLFFDFINIPWQSNGNGPEIVTGPLAARVKPVWHASIDYRTPQGRKVTYAKQAIAGDSLDDICTQLLASLKYEPGRKVSQIVPDSFRASFNTMQISASFGSN